MGGNLRHLHSFMQMYTRGMLVMVKNGKKEAICSLSKQNKHVGNITYKKITGAHDHPIEGGVWAQNLQLLLYLPN